MNNMFKLSGIILLLLIVYSCKKPTIPWLYTNAVTDISYTTAKFGGKIDDEGGDPPILRRGVC